MNELSKIRKLCEERIVDKYPDFYDMGINRLAEEILNICGEEPEKKDYRDVYEVIQIPVKDRTKEQHMILAKHYGGMCEYLESMGEFKDVSIEKPKENVFENEDIEVEPDNNGIYIEQKNVEERDVYIEHKNFELLEKAIKKAKELGKK